jgi:xylulokinase
MPASLGIDVGLSGVRAAVMDATGAVVASAKEPVRPRIDVGVVEQDAAAWIPATFAAGADSVRAAGIAIDAVAVTALGPAPVLIDEAGEPLVPTPLFGLDRRADPWRERLGTGLDHALPSIVRWHETEPETSARARVALDAAGFVVRELTGAETIDRITAESYRWPGVEVPVPVPDPAEPDAVAGGLEAGAAARLRLVPGIPVAVGTIDCFADAAAAGVEREGDGVILLGSTLIVYAVAPRGTAVAGLDTTSHVGGDGSLVGGSTTSAGLALDWIAGLLGGRGSELATQAATLVPGGGGLVALPYLAGERTPINDPTARGVLAGLSLATGRVQLYRAMIDGVAVTALDHTSRLERAGIAPSRYRIAGGGVHNEAWLKATCDAVGRPLEVMSDPGTAVGAAWLGLLMLGAAPHRATIRTLEPDAGRHERYVELLSDARDLWAGAGSVVRRLG